MKINIYNKKHKQAIKDQYYNRDNKGRFSKRKIAFYLFAILSILAIAYVGANWNKTKYIEVEKEKIVLDSSAEQIIINEKSDILDTLKNCEQCKPSRPDCVNWNDGGMGKDKASWGNYMLKISTIQGFQKGLNDYQAIQLAMDETSARNLSEHIIFETPNGVWNWKNCMVKNNLLDRVNFVLELKNKVK
jgi:hypothetical protein